MDTNTLLIIIVVLLMLGGGGFFYRRRYRETLRPHARLPDGAAGRTLRRHFHNEDTAA